jgi:hypothetical protein
VLAEGKIRETSFQATFKNSLILLLKNDAQYMQWKRVEVRKVANLHYAWDACPQIIVSNEYLQVLVMQCQICIILCG